MQLPSQNVLLTVTENKQQLIAIIFNELINDKTFHQKCCSNMHKLIVTGQEDTPVEVNNTVVIERDDLRTTHEEAYNIIVQQMVAAANENQTSILVMSDDTDVFVLALFHYHAQNLTLPVYMESPVKERSIIDIKSTVERHAEIIPYILAAHAVSGCDTVACYYGIGKGKVLKVLKSGLTLNAVGDIHAQTNDIIQETTTFVSTCYGVPQSLSMTETRLAMWAKKVAASSKIMPKLSSLPPTTESFAENVKRAHLQACVWKHALDQNPPDMSSVEYGWVHSEATQSLTPRTVPDSVSPAPASIMKLIKCQCESGSSCANGRCGCNRARLGCTMFCACKGSSSCRNEQTAKST